MKNRTYIIDVFDDIGQIVEHILYKCNDEQEANKKAKQEAELLGCLLWDIKEIL